MYRETDGKLWNVRGCAFLKMRVKVNFLQVVENE